LYTADVVKQPLRYEAGYLIVPDDPGLGVDIDEDRLQEMTAGARWTFGADLAGAIDRTVGTPGS
jgi:hypothetical protein